MSIGIGGAVLLLVQATAALPDTIATKSADHGWFQTVTAIASGLMTIGVLVLTVFLVPAAWNFRKSYQKVSDMMDRVYGDINPIMRHASSIADNVDYVSTSIRTDVQQVRNTVQLANERLLAAVLATEQRVQEFSALLQVVQREAEDTFVAAASTVRGVRVGASQLRTELERDLPVARTSELEAAAAALERSERAVLEAELAQGLDEAFETGEGINGDISTSTTERDERPRIRARGGRDT